MKIGLCAGTDKLGAARKLGYEFVECALRDVAQMDEADFRALLDETAASPVKIEVCNCMLPARIRLTGPNPTPEAEVRAYLQTALGRAAQLGVRVVIFGSGASRGVSEGFDGAAARAQVAGFLRLAEEYLCEYGVMLGIEPLCRRECNLINRVSEAAGFARALSLKHVRAMGDVYHMSVEGEPLDALTRAGGYVLHLHAAQPLTRRYPDAGGPWTQLFECAAALGDDCRVSVEATLESDFEAEAGRAFEALSEARARAAKNGKNDK